MATIDDVPGNVEAMPIAALKYAFWMFYHNNQNYQIKVKVWFINVGITMSQLRPLFVSLFGEDPTGSTGKL